MKPKRKNKPGAGRPKKLLEPTVPIRVPKSLALFILEHLADIRDWKEGRKSLHDDGFSDEP